jgi:transcriptional regulator of acetoin/glycerol metabolism
MASMIPFPPAGAQADRLARISQARQAFFHGQPQGGTALALEGWLERSWRRGLAQGHQPERTPSFDMVPAPALQRTLDESRMLRQAARPVLEKLGRAIADTRYFALLTNQHGVVVDVDGPIDRRDRRAELISRLGTDLSEQQVGTTAVGVVLAERQPVWLHRGEHFFNTASVYSCAGAPLFGPDGSCVGMLDLTGIEAQERPELKHLVTQSARSIENALTLSRPHRLLIRLNWPGRAMGGDEDGLVCVNADGCVTGANPTARQMVPHLNVTGTSAVHCSDLFAMPFETLFDAARRGALGQQLPLDVPLWSGLRLQALPLAPGDTGMRNLAGCGTTDPRPLREVEAAMIRKAVEDARGNVMQAARALGISRATVYRKLGHKLRF